MPDAMGADTSDSVSAEADAATAAPAASGLPEVEAYASLLVLMLLTDGKHWAEVGEAFSCNVVRFDHGVNLAASLWQGHAPLSCCVLHLPDAG